MVVKHQAKAAMDKNLTPPNQEGRGYFRNQLGFFGLSADFHTRGEAEGKGCPVPYYQSQWTDTVVSNKTKTFHCTPLYACLRYIGMTLLESTAHRSLNGHMIHTLKLIYTIV